MVYDLHLRQLGQERLALHQDEKVILDAESGGGPLQAWWVDAFQPSGVSRYSEMKRLGKFKEYSLKFWDAHLK